MQGCFLFAGDQQWMDATQEEHAVGARAAPTDSLEEDLDLDEEGEEEDEIQETGGEVEGRETVRLATVLPEEDQEGGDQHSKAEGEREPRHEGELEPHQTLFNHASVVAEVVRSDSSASTVVVLPDNGMQKVQEVKCKVSNLLTATTAVIVAAVVKEVAAPLGLY